jgi:iron(III) transport system substrate-binding protein
LVRRLLAAQLRTIVRWALLGLVPMVLSGCPRGNGNEEILVTVNDEGGGEATTNRAGEHLVALARAEGEVTWFTSTPAAEAAQFVRGFESKYPPLRVRLVRGGTFDLTDRIERDLSAGTLAADVMHVLDPAIFVALRQRGELMAYSSPAAAAIPPEYRDPGYWCAARIVVLGMAYDRRRVTDAEVPHQWPVLLQQRWKGKVGLKDAQTAGSAYAQYYFLREKYGQDFWEQFAAQKPRIYKTEDDLLEALTGGEIQVAAGVMGYRMNEYARRYRQTVGMIWPSDGVPLVIGPVAILSRAPHPNAARLFVDYCLSKEGQAALRDLLGAYSPRPDVAPPRDAPRLSDLKLLRPPAGWAEYLGKQGELRAEYARLFHGESE